MNMLLAQQQYQVFPDLPGLPELDLSLSSIEFPEFPTLHWNTSSFSAHSMLVPGDSVLNTTSHDEHLHRAVKEDLLRLEAQIEQLLSTLSDGACITKVNSILGVDSM